MIAAFCALLAAILFSPSYASAQNSTLQGSVKTEKGEPVPGATIILSGTQQGVTTDAQGNFLLRLAKKPAADASLLVSYLGYKSQTLPIGSRTSFDIVLQEESTSMDEVVVVGYGTMRKKDLTGSLSSIGGEAILNRQSPTISQALQGAMPGVTVTRTNSAPGGSATIRIRGITSMTDGASDPYVLIDGVAGSIDDVNPNDIENITVLKDAASASIYGSQAAAGVILITTKRAGKSGASVTYNYTLGLDFQSQKPKYMNASDYMAAVNELRYNDLPSGGWYQDYSREYVENYAMLNRENPDLYPNVDWMDLILKDVGVRHSHSLTIQSGGDQAQLGAEPGLRRRGRPVPQEPLVEALHGPSEQRHTGIQVDESLGRHFAALRGSAQPPFIAVGSHALHPAHLSGQMERRPLCPGQRRP